MLARLTTITTSIREWDVHITASDNAALVSTDKNTLVVDLQALRWAVATFHDDALQRFAKECEKTFIPIYNSLQSTIKSDFDNVVEVLSGLERNPGDSYPQRPNSPLPLDELVLSVDSRPPIPRIIITPCSPQECSHVPLQNSAFGSRLTVPSYPVVNHTHPPLALLPHTSPYLRDWTWCMGHWEVTLPSSCENGRRGLCLRVPIKRKTPRRVRKRP